MFLGTFENKVDKKGRVSVPASFRQNLNGDQGTQFVAFCSFRFNCIEACDISFMEKLKNKADSFDLFSQEHDDLTTVIFGESLFLSLDPEGRTLLPSHFLEHTGIQEKAAFVGVGELFQIWRPTALEEHKRKSRTRLQQKALTIPQQHSKDV